MERRVACYQNFVIAFKAAYCQIAKAEGWPRIQHQRQPGTGGKRVHICPAFLDACSGIVPARNSGQQNGLGRFPVRGAERFARTQPPRGPQALDQRDISGNSAAKFNVDRTYQGAPAGCDFQRWSLAIPSWAQCYLRREIALARQQFANFPLRPAQKGRTRGFVR